MADWTGQGRHLADCRGEQGMAGLIALSRHLLPYHKAGRKALIITLLPKRFEWKIACDMANSTTGAAPLPA
jgi:hypothetical protein